jgi:hypothetical protein
MLDPAKLREDLIFGAADIGKVLQELGVIEENDENVESKVYYYVRAKKLPITKWGKTLVSTRTKLVNAVRALAA